MAYTFTNIINPADPTFNQELGINNSDVIAGYNGNGNPGHPNQGYTTTTAGTTFNSENFPGSVQTQVTGLNNKGTTVGFFSPTNNGSDANFGFLTSTAGSYTAVVDPMTNSKPSTNQLLGINDNGVAVGFYNDANGKSHGYEYNVSTGAFTPVVDPAQAASSLQATGIDNAGDVVGFFVNGAGFQTGFVDKGGVFTTIRVPNFTNTQVFGINNNGLAVGTATGAKGFVEGFVYNIATKAFTIITDPNGKGNTFANGINDAGDVVGFYVNSAGNTIGMLATPATPKVTETGATAQSFDAWSTLAPNAGTHSSLLYDNGARGFEAWSVAAASSGPHYS